MPMFWRFWTTFSQNAATSFFWIKLWRFWMLKDVNLCKFVIVWCTIYIFIERKKCSKASESRNLLKNIDSVKTILRSYVQELKVSTYTVVISTKFPLRWNSKTSVGKNFYEKLLLEDWPAVYIQSKKHYHVMPHFEALNE